MTRCEEEGNRGEESANQDGGELEEGTNGGLGILRSAVSSPSALERPLLDSAAE